MSLRWWTEGTRLELTDAIIRLISQLFRIFSLLHGNIFYLTACCCCKFTSSEVNISTCDLDIFMNDDDVCDDTVHVIVNN